MSEPGEKLGRLLASGGPEATTDGLRAVVERRAAQRSRRQRAGGAGLLVVLVVIAGVAVLGRGAPPAERSATAPVPDGALVWRPPTASGTTAGSSTRSLAPSAAVACTDGATCFGPAPLHPLFSRSVGSVEVVATLLDVRGGAPVPTPAGAASPDNSANSAAESPAYTCATAAELSVVVSAGQSSRATLVLPSVVGSTTAIEAVATVTVPTPTGTALAVVVRTSSLVRSTQARFADGRRDEMATVDGWSVLVDPASTPGRSTEPSSLLALGQAGQTLSSEPIVRSSGIALPQFCLAEGPIGTPVPTPRASG